MPTLEQRLSLLEDRRAILRTLHDYGHCLDYGDEAGFLDCWTPDAVLGWSILPQPLRGHAQIRAGFHQHTHAPQAWHKHLLAEPQIQLDGDVAQVRSMFFRLDPYPEAGGPEIYAFGRYVDRLVRCADGRWRFTERRVEKEAFHGEA
jgi:ketosteroid isomerase-like protein